MNQERPCKKVAIEDLLRLKRAERPPPEFWNRFERELRAKQLAAIVEKRPWWRSLPKGVWSLSRAQIPLGAAAILAVTFVTVREYRAPSLVSAGAPAPAFAVEARPVDNPETFLSQGGTTSPRSELPDVALSTSTVTDEQAAVAKIAPGFSTPPAASPESSSLNLSTPAQLSAALPDNRSADSSLVASLGAASGFESRALPVRSPVTDPLSQMAAPKSVRLRDRYLGGVFPAGYSVDPASASSDHAATKLRDRQLRPEEFSRFDARGNSLSIKL